MAVVGLALLVCASVHAADAKKGQTVITSGQLTYDYKRSIAVFEENVVVQDPQVRIMSDTLTVLFDQTNEVKSVTALGNVRIESENRRARCRKAIYLARRGEIMLSGDAELQRDKDKLSGDQITYWLNEERVLCKPGRLVIYSDEDTSGGLRDHLRGKPRGTDKR
jgi:lipopolysaccharide export system protein LptA